MNSPLISVSFIRHSLLHFYLGMTNYRIGLHRATSDHVCKREIVISKAKPKSAGITFRANKPPGTHLAHYKLGRHKSSIKPRSSVTYMVFSLSAPRQ